MTQFVYFCGSAVYWLLCYDSSGASTCVKTSLAYRFKISHFAMLVSFHVCFACHYVNQVWLHRNGRQWHGSVKTNKCKVNGNDNRKHLSLVFLKVKWPGNVIIKLEALVSGHPQGAKTVSITGAGRLRECEKTEFVWEFSKTGFWLGGRKKTFPLTRLSVKGASTVL